MKATHATGFTLIEVLIAIGLFVVIAVSVAQLAAAATQAMRTSREHTTAVVLAAAKMDQLRALDWTYEPEVPGVPPVPRSDVHTNLSDPAYSQDGPGLTSSPPDALVRSTPGYVDYLDGDGRWVGNGLDPPRDAVFVRRWSVRPLAADPDRTLILQVLVTTTRLERRRGAAVWTKRSDTEVVLVSLRTRRG